MPTFNATFSNATASTAGWGSWDRIVFSSGTTWTAGRTWSIAGTSSQGQFTLGSGYLGTDHTSSNYISVLVFGKRVYIGQRDRVVFGGITDNSSTALIKAAVGFNQQTTGAGFFSIQNQQGVTDSAIGLGIFQGRLAVFGRYSIQLWTVSSDPNQFSLLQTLLNIGTPASNSIQGLGGGELDLLFVDDTGIRSLRTLVTTLNATTFDVGSPVDTVVQQALQGGNQNLICSCVEPLSKRYWVVLGQTIYVLSYFPQAKIQAWSQYEARDSLGTLFTPDTFALFQGQQLVRGGNKVYAYGGITVGTPTYDSSQVTLTTPWLDAKTPKTRKASVAIGAAFAGNWTIQAGTQPSTGTLRTVIAQGSTVTPTETIDSALDLAPFPFTDDGTHIQIQATSTTVGTFANPVKFSLLEWIYNIAQNE